MAGSKPRSESLRERSAGTNRRCVAVSDDYKMEGANVTSSEGEAMAFKFGSVVRSEKRSVFGVISDVSSGIAEGANAFCENVGDMIKNAKNKKEAEDIKNRNIEAEKIAEAKEKKEFLEGKEKEQEVVGKAVKAKYSIEAAEAAIRPKAFGEVVRKREPEKKEKKQDNFVNITVANASEEKQGFDFASLLSRVKEFFMSGRKGAGIAAMCVVVILAGVITFTCVNYSFAYVGSIAGSDVTVKSPEQFEKIVANVNENLNANYDKEVSAFEASAFEFEKKIVKKGSITPDEDVANLLLATSDEFVEMHVVYAGDKAMLGVKDEQTAKKVLETFKKYYTGGDEDVDFTTDKELEYVLEIAPASIMMSDIDAAVMKLNGGEKQKNTYIVEEGDNPWSIANKFDTDIDTILSMNNMSEGDTIDIGDEIIVEAFIPVVNVTTTQIVKRTESIPYETETVKDNSKYNTWSETTVKGKNGEAEIEEKIIKVNGKVTSTEVISKKVLSEPVTRVRTVGTKEPPRGVGSGSFIAPARGYISSRYGNRSRGFHTGLDIAGSYGSAIVAADDGKVSFVGWSGGYGKLVKIDHQNGYVTYYAHNSSFAVSVGQTVSKGQTIAYMGSTGNSTGNHCHFEVIKNGQRQNPEKYI